MADQVTVYVSILKDSLKEKYEVMQKILDATKRQAEILSSDPVDADAFDEMLSQKEELISRIFTLDGGFERVFSKVNPFIQADPQSFKPEILEMQNYIRIITECSMKIQALEQKNKNKFEMFVKKRFVILMRVTKPQHRIIKICQISITNGRLILWIRKNNKKINFFVEMG